MWADKFDYMRWVRAVRDYFVRVGDALSQLVNVVILFSDNPNESISGRAWRRREQSHFWGIMRVTIDWLASPVEADHCEKSHTADVGRAARLLRNQGL